MEVTWSDSAVWRLNITEISDINHFVSYELVEAEPPLGTSSLQAKIHLLRVSDENHTFVSWVKFYSEILEFNFIYSGN